MSTEENIGYHDAIRQVHRSIDRRVKTLEERLKNAPPEEKPFLIARMAELQHMTQVVESLRR